MTSVNWSLSFPFPSAQLRRSWSTWTQTGPCYVGTASACRTWTVTKSPVGSPAAAWQESWSSPAHRRSERGSPPPTRTYRHTDGQTVLQDEGEFRGSRLEKGWRRDGDGTFTEEGRERTSDQSETLRVTVTRRYGAEMSDVGKESNYKRLMSKSAGENNQRKYLSDTETVSQWREDSFKR